MKVLLKQALVADPHSPYNGQTKDLLIDGGIIRNVDSTIDSKVDTIIHREGLIVSPGWIDPFSHFNDPGFEYKETLETGAEAAASGGYTHVFVIPNTSPALSAKAQVEYVVQKAKALPVHIMPLGAITKNTEGKELAEMYDMKKSGAIAFTDGINPVQAPALFLKALQYLKAIDGVIIQLPVDTSVGHNALMNEGITSTRLGLPGVPAIFEHLIIARDIELCKYTNGKLHITGVSTAKSIALIAHAKKEGLLVSCSVTPYHLFFCDEDLHEYNSNLKVNPPLRGRSDMLALRQAIEDEIIDCVSTHHLPQDWDSKTCEFEYAKPGMIGLESCFSVFNTLFPHASLKNIVDLFSVNAQRIFNTSIPCIDEGNIACLTMFDRNSIYTFDNSCIRSKSKNSAFIGASLTGKVVGIINKDSLYLND